ncbi:hypothetical protein GGS20DRAFT_264445 [Poronia punctata]|nr:hypothetical protein GGS20DRAFT_264445 [Poronia punctata]
MSLATEGTPTEAQDEWVKVQRRKGRHSRPGTAGVRARAGPVASADLAPVPSPPSLSLEQVKEDHDRISGHWKSSASFGRLQGLLADNTASRSVTKAICFGLGTFDPADGAWDQKRKAHIQLAAFLSIVDHLQAQGGRQIPCFFQDPVFNSADKTFIESLGHQVVESPLGFRLIDESALAFGVHLYKDIYSQIIAIHTPAMFIGTAYQVWEDFHGVDNFDWARMKDLDEACVKAAFPENPTDTAFSSTTIHWCQRNQGRIS